MAQPHDSASRVQRMLEWLVRAAFVAVFAINVTCALQFALEPAAFMGAYGLSGAAGEAATRGMGVAFLMWNATYPPLIASPRRFPVLGWVILAQQAIGLAGEAAILASLGAEGGMLAASIERFIAFDGAGLALMAASWGVWRAWWRRCRAREAADGKPCG